MGERIRKENLWIEIKTILMWDFSSLLSFLPWLKIFVLTWDVCISFYIISSCHHSNSDWIFYFIFVFLQKMYNFYFQLCFWIHFFFLFLFMFRESDSVERTIVGYLIHHLGIEIAYVFWVRIFRREPSMAWRWFLFPSTSNAFIITLKEVKVMRQFNFFCLYCSAAISSNMEFIL